MDADDLDFGVIIETVVRKARPEIGGFYLWTHVEGRTWVGYLLDETGDYWVVSNAKRKDEVESRAFRKDEWLMWAPREDK